MTFAKLKLISVDEAAKKLAVDILAGYYPSGCHCAEMTTRCGYCKEWPRVFANVTKLLRRVSAVKA